MAPSTTPCVSPSRNKKELDGTPRSYMSCVSSKDPSYRIDSTTSFSKSVFDDDSETSSDEEEEEETEEEVMPPPKRVFAKTSMHAPPNALTKGMKYRFMEEPKKRVRTSSGSKKDEDKENVLLPRVGGARPPRALAASGVPKTTAKAKAPETYKRPETRKSNSQPSYEYTRLLVDWSNFPWYKSGASTEAESRLVSVPAMCYSKQGTDIMFPSGLPGLCKDPKKALKEWNSFIIQTNAPSRSPGFRLSAALVKENSCQTYCVPHAAPESKYSDEKETVVPHTGFAEAVERLRVTGPVLLKALFDNYERFLEIYKESKSEANFSVFCENLPADCSLTADVFNDLLFFLTSLRSFGRSVYHDAEASGQVPVLFDHTGAPHPATSFKPLRGYFESSSSTASAMV